MKTFDESSNFEDEQKYSIDEISPHNKLNIRYKSKYNFKCTCINFMIPIELNIRILLYNNSLPVQDFNYIRFRRSVLFLHEIVILFFGDYFSLMTLQNYLFSNFLF